jgi:hypothetical protein
MAGITRPTNLTSGERPHRGVVSNSIENPEHVGYSLSANPPVTESRWPHFLSLPALWFPWNVNANAYRLGTLVTIALCILGIDKRHHGWMHVSDDTTESALICLPQSFAHCCFIRAR